MTSNGLTALITGATSGIGRATANKLAQLGIQVVVVGRNAERGKKTVDEIRGSGGKAEFISSDLRDAASARKVARRALELGNGHVDILINNAGIYPFGPTHEMTEELFDRVYSLNVKAPYFLVAELAPLMAKRGKGAIVNLSTMVADYGAAGMSLYGSSKAAINLLTKTWAAEYGPKGVRVNVVSPGPTRTEGTDAMGEGLEKLAAQAPAGRPATADEIAEAIVFLASDRSSFVYGAKLAVDGGRTAIWKLSQPTLSGVELIEGFWALSGCLAKWEICELNVHNDRKAVRVMPATAADAELASAKNGKGGGIVVVAGTSFHDGTIEVDVAGKPRTGTTADARGFVGLAFRVSDDLLRYECFYIRPTNGRADDQVRRNHSTQYISMPEYEWSRLRKESPGQYESYVDLVPGAWTKIKIEVSGVKAQLFVNESPQPVLIVHDLKHGHSKGAVALWIGMGTEAYFANLRLSK